LADASVAPVPSDDASVPEDLGAPRDASPNDGGGDGGSHPLLWRASSSGITQGLQAVWGSSAADVWAIGYSFLHGTGSPLTWSKVAAPVPLAYAAWGSSASNLWVAASVTSPGITAVTMNGTGSPIDAWTRGTGVADFGLYGIWGASASDVWAVGDDATILHGVGEPLGWYTFTSDVEPSAPRLPSSFVDCRQLYGVWGSGPGDVWIVGSAETIFHVSGGPPTIDVSRTTTSADGQCGSASFINIVYNHDLRGIWGSSASNLWAVGHDGLILHGSGSPVTWTQVASGTSTHLTSIWGASSEDVWAVGLGGAIVHGTGSPITWTTSPSGTTADLRSVWGSSSSDVWAVGANGTILHYSH
jgi:hypothetical protein